MNEINYIGPDELVFTNDIKEGIHSGGFGVNSIMMKAGMSPIVTFNDNQTGGNNVSDLFANLVVPNWVLSYNHSMIGGRNQEKEYNSDDSDDDDDVIEDDLHDKLLDLVKQTTPIKQHKTTKRNRHAGKKTRRKRV